MQLEVRVDGNDPPGRDGSGLDAGRVLGRPSFVRAVLPQHGKTDHPCNGPDPIPVLIQSKKLWPSPGGQPEKRGLWSTDDLGGTFLALGAGDAVDCSVGSTHDAHPASRTSPTPGTARDV